MSTRVRQAFQSAAGAAGGGALDVDEVFSTYVYKGNGSSQTITNGIDLAGEGGLVWVKNRDANATAALVDTERGASYSISPSEVDAQAYNTTANINALNSDGFTVGTGNYTRVNGSSYDYASWTFRKAPKFFDVVTYTGNGSSQNISHNLGSVPGMIMVKATSNPYNWAVWHRESNASPETRFLVLNDSTPGYTNTNIWNSTNPTDSVFSVGDFSNTNNNGSTYVAYLFAHNDGDGEFGPDGDADIIKCGSYTGNGSFNGPEINLGFEPQWLLVKNDSSSEPWLLIDNMRGFGWRQSSSSNDGLVEYFMANDSTPEYQDFWFSPTATGFKCQDNGGITNGSGQSYIYMAIRRGPMAVPESASEVFALDYAGNASSTAPWFTSGFPVDLGIHRTFTSTNNFIVTSRLIQGKYLRTNGTNAETNITGAKFDFMNGFYDLALPASTDTIGWMWKRAPNFFDVVAYTGDGTAGRTVSHNLGVAPEMMWVKNRNTPIDWWCYHKDLGNTKYVKLNTPDFAFTDSTAWNNTTPSDTVFTLGTSGRVNYGSSSSGDPYIAYLFASLPGISKVGSYTGDGTINGSKFIDCGFSNGPALVIIKIYEGEDANHWHIFDTARGLVAGNDSLLYLNRTTAEGTTLDFIDPHSSGFFVGCASNTKNNTNVLGSKYIFYAIAA